MSLSPFDRLKVIILPLGVSKGVGYLPVAAARRFATSSQLTTFQIALR